MDLSILFFFRSSHSSRYFASCRFLSLRRVFPDKPKPDQSHWETGEILSKKIRAIPERASKKPLDFLQTSSRIPRDDLFGQVLRAQCVAGAIFSERYATRDKRFQLDFPFPTCSPLSAIVLRQPERKDSRARASQMFLARSLSPSVSDSDLRDTLSRSRSSD